MERLLTAAGLAAAGLSWLNAWHYRRWYRRRDMQLRVTFDELGEHRRRLHAAEAYLAHVTRVAVERGLQDDLGMRRTYEQIQSAKWAPQE